MYSQSDYEIKLSQENEFRDLARVAQTDQLLEDVRPRRRAAFRQSARAALYGIGHLLMSIITIWNVPLLTHRR
jgi:hypothetical protein